ncbi:MAG TPA: hypothetical protein VF772_00010 [Terriglobales bacterium]
MLLRTDSEPIFIPPSWWVTVYGTCSLRGVPTPWAVGLLSGGYGQDELERAGAYRVYQDPRDLLEHLDELGVRSLK